MPPAESPPPYIIAFLTLQIFGFIGMVLILISSLMLHKKKRYAIWVSFCMAWIVFTAGYCLLLVTGQQFKSSLNSGICITQSAFAYAAPPLGSSATFSFVLYVSTTFIATGLAIVRQKPIFKTRNMEYIVTGALVATPWIIYLTLFAVFLAFGIRHPDLVGKTSADPFCLLLSGDPCKFLFMVVKHTKANLFGKNQDKEHKNATPITTAVTATPIIIAEVIIAIDICRKRQSVKIIAQIPIGMIVRVACFTVATFGVIIFSLIYTFNDQSDKQLYIILSITPALGVLAFGIPKNIFRFRPFAEGGWWQRQSKTLSYLPTVSNSESNVYLHTINLSDP
ncbi:hypothetical protein BDQ17DRAFT_1424585 [Cyathus striatus]|nr:hypothetical protein BDQ17DRAFT_1424585 [Cyathus striatus]